MKRFIDTVTKVLFSLLLAFGILWWMYRGIEWADVREAMRSEMRWGWMLASLPFGILAQMLRAFRWRQLLEPLGERPRHSTCVHSIFISYASSLVVPRIGEVLRCAVLRRWDGVSFSQSLGTVVTERVVDIVVMLLLSLLTIVAEIPVFASFVARTGMSFTGILRSFTTTGYIVTLVCGAVALGTAIYLLRRFRVFGSAQKTLHNLLDGLLSIRSVRNKGLFVVYTLGIWLAYYLHFYIAFFCFPFTQGLGATAALVAFVVGTFAVLVPTPNGAGAWHFAVKTVLMLYGVAVVQGAMFALIVHAVQTLLVLLLGLFALFSLCFSAKHRDSSVV